MINGLLVFIWCNPILNKWCIRGPSQAFDLVEHCLELSIFFISGRKTKIRHVELHFSDDIDDVDDDVDDDIDDDVLK